MSDEYAFAHEGYCNASRRRPVGCDGCSCRAGHEIKQLRRALSDFVEMYVEAAKSGDWGFWNPEEDEEVIAARAALALSRPHRQGESS